MANDKDIAQHYLHGNLTGAIEEGLTKLGKTKQTATVEDLGPVDEFHIGGRPATKELLDQLSLSEDKNVVDVGCGLGGTARLIADSFGARVSGVDIAQEYIDTGNELNEWVGLGDKITLAVGSGVEMPYDDSSFSAGVLIHVGMNIEDKAKLFNEIYRIMQPGSSFGVYDIMRVGEGALAYPCPWAKDESTSFLASPDEYKQEIEKAGFTVTAERNRQEFALEFFKAAAEKTKANGGPPPLSLHTLMQDSTPMKLKNLAENIKNGLLSPVEIIITK